MPINWRLAAPEVRYILEHSGARALVCDEALSTWPTRRPTASKPGSVRVCLAPGVQRPDGRHWPTCRAAPGPSAHVPVARRRHPPTDVHLGHHRTTQGRHDHPRQPGVEEPRPHRRVRLHGRRSRPGLRAAVPRRCARPHDHVADRRRGDHHHPPLVRRRSRGGRARAFAGDHGVAGARHGERHHGVARHRATRPVVGAGGHQRRREDADPAHRTDPTHLSLGLVRRRLRAHRDGVGRHLPRPGQHGQQARERGPSLPVPRARHLGPAGRSVPGRGARRDRDARPEGRSRATGGTPRPLPRPSPEGGSTPGTSASGTTTATSTSSTGSRT